MTPTERKEFYKPNKAKIKTFIVIIVIAGICLLILVSAAGKSLSSGALFGLGSLPKTEIYEAIAGLLAFVLYLPTLVLWLLFSLIEMAIVGIILGFILTIFYWYYLSCLIYSFKERKKRS